MSEKARELESHIRKLLPISPTLKNNPAIPKLTEELIKEGANVEISRASSYTHSVCHLFEGYGKVGSPSYLNLTAQLSTAGELANYTIKKAMDAQNFGCVDRIIYPIMKLNLLHIDEGLDNFTFKPEILTDTGFIMDFSSERKGGGYESQHLIDFCRSGDIGEFFLKYTEARRREKGLPSIAGTNEVVSGVFIDVEGTLIGHDVYDQGDRFRGERLPLTQEYALKKIKEGIPVTIFTGAHPEDIIKNLEYAGVDEKLHDVKSKDEFIGKTLETCVDDTNPIMQGFRAKTYYNSGKIAWDAEYSTDK